MPRKIQYCSEAESAEVRAMLRQLYPPTRTPDLHLVHDTGSGFDVVRISNGRRFFVSTHATEQKAISVASKLPNFIRGNC